MKLIDKLLAKLPSDDASRLMIIKGGYNDDCNWLVSER